VRKLYETLLEKFGELHGEVLKALDALPAEALDWSPGPEMNSLSVLAVHLMGAERYWIGDVVQGDPSFRNREAEFQVKGLDATTLKQRLADLDAYEVAALEKLRLRDLDEVRVSPRDGKQVTVGWALLHPLQHTGQHVGHMQVLVQQWKQKGSA
jgi:uncharacterized damage-inducible protein DinB